MGRYASEGICSSPISITFQETARLTPVNIGSRVVADRAAVGGADCRTRFGHPLLPLETFFDARRFHGGVHSVANWMELGLTQGPGGPERVCRRSKGLMGSSILKPVWQWPSSH